MQGARKSNRLLKGLNKIDQAFDEIPKAPSLYEKVLLLGQLGGLGLHWHFDYLAHLHRAKVIAFDDATYQRIFRAPGEQPPQYNKYPPPPVLS